MSKQIRSRRGVGVDFEKIRIIEQISSLPKSIEVKRREDFINTKLRNKIKRTKKTSIKKELEDVDNASNSFIDTKNHSDDVVQVDVTPQITKRTGKRDNGESK